MDKLKRTAIGLLAFLVSLEGLDAALTIWAIRHGYVEQNRIMAPIADSLWLIPVKVLPVIAVGFFVTWAVGRFSGTCRPASLAILFGLVAAVVFVGMVVIKNLVTLIR